MTLLLLGFSVWQLGFLSLAGWCYALAGNILLLAFALLIFWVTGVILQVAFHDIKRYFRQESRILRRFVMLQFYQHASGQKLLLEKRQLHYLTQLEQQRLLAANNKKQSRLLFKAIKVELADSMTPSSYKALKQHQKQADPQAMLSLRNNLLCQASITG
ncbi:hypothetical protein A1359_15515 [Methylomonas lenta]|uniref:Uncharacterized protein n=2 Tax=Methylomonas lenta TaxID=980561 RepID=A0A177N143_9GAMM|nr:hypothetical protein A1359_15515 [Methylomonas lenta]